jgi:hypothetical protein
VVGICLLDLVGYAYLYNLCWFPIGLLDFNLISLVYLDVEDTHHNSTFLDGGAVLTLPLFCLEGICFILHGFEYGGFAFAYLLKMCLMKLTAKALLICTVAFLLLQTCSSWVFLPI